LTLVTLDTSCVVSLISTREKCPPELLRLVRLAMDGQINVCVTEIVDKEVPQDGGESAIQRRAYIRSKLAQFPETRISSSRSAQRDELAQRFLGILWPNAEGNSRGYEHSKRDCLHLACHRLCGGDLFVTLDKGLARKARTHADELGIVVLEPAGALQRVEDQTPSAGADGVWDPVVRRALEDDRGDVKDLLNPVRASYDDFDSWLGSALQGKEVWVAQLNGCIGAVAVWSKKTDTTIKLATFFVGDDHRGRALGPHLLFHQLRHWIDMKISKVFVTVSSERLDALTFFLAYGFRIEGTSARRYKSTAVEFILAKHLFYEVVTDERVVEFLEQVGSQIFDLPTHQSVRNARNWFLPPSFGALRLAHDDSGSVTHVDVFREDGVARSIAISELEELLYPARFALRGRKAYMIPIKPQWADRLMDIPRHQLTMLGSRDGLALRTDNTYYCHPYFAGHELCEAPALFYVSSPDQIVAGFARIVERTIAEPEDLFLKYERTGIYGLDEIRRHIKKSGPDQGCAMAIRFAWWVPFPRPVGLKELRAMGLHHPQHIEAIDYADYEKLLAAGGVTL